MVSRGRTCGIDSTRVVASPTFPVPTPCIAPDGSTLVTSPPIEYAFAATYGRSGLRRLCRALAACEGVIATPQAEPAMHGRTMRWALTGQFSPEFLAARYVAAMRESRTSTRAAIRADLSPVFAKWYGGHVLSQLGEERCLVIRVWRDPVTVIASIAGLGLVPGTPLGTLWLGDPRWERCRLRLEPADRLEAVAWHVVETIIRSEEIERSFPRARVARLDFDVLCDADLLAAWLRHAGFRPGDGYEQAVSPAQDLARHEPSGLRSIDRGGVRSAWRRVVDLAAGQGLLPSSLAESLLRDPTEVDRGRRLGA